VFASNAAFSLKPSFVPEFNQKFDGHVLLLLQKQEGLREKFGPLDDGNTHGQAAGCGRAQGWRQQLPPQ